MPAATEQSEPDVTQIRQLEERLDSFRIDTSPDLTIRGSAWEGYAFNCYACDEIPESQGGGTTGACCIGAECSILTQNQCLEAGGIYQGDGTPCNPNPCTSGGACCPTDGNLCFIAPDEATCEAMSGRYLGDGTTCDGVICATCGECICSGFPPFPDGMGGFWTHQEVDCDGMITFSGATTAGTSYAIQISSQRCCDPCTGSGFDCTGTFFCDYTDPMFPVCNAFISSGCLEPVDCSSDPPGPCETSTIQDLFGLADPPC